MRVQRKVIDVQKQVSREPLAARREGSPELRGGRGGHPGGAVTAARRDPRA